MLFQKKKEYAGERISGDEIALLAFERDID